MTPVKGSSLGLLGGDCRRYPGGTENTSILRTVSRWSPNTREASRMLIPSTITALRTRRYTSTLYIHHTIHGFGYNPMNDGGRYSIQSPFVSNLPPAWSTLPPPITHHEAGTAFKEAHVPIREALNAYKGLSQFKYEVFLQGSYKNDTNLGGDSDVDVVIRLASKLKPSVVSLSGKRLQADGSHRFALERWQSFRDHANEGNEGQIREGGQKRTQDHQAAERDDPGGRRPRGDAEPQGGHRVLSP